MKTVSLKIPGTMDSQLEELAGRTGRSKSFLVRMALARFLPRPSRPSTRSFLARAADLAGSVRGAADLSTNKRRLEGYGR